MPTFMDAVIFFLIDELIIQQTITKDISLYKLKEIIIFVDYRFTKLTNP
jgi:hypothetical protein